jgi:hypothetical protein
LVETGELTDPMVATVSANTLVEPVTGKEIEQLRENGSSLMHEPLLAPENREERLSSINEG